MTPQSSIAATGYRPRPWRPTPLVGASLLVHAVCVAAFVADPADWPWILATLAANHLLLTAAVLSPRARLLGPNVNRLPDPAARRREVALTFDDGPDPELTPRILELLDRHHAKASFFCVGQKATAHPAIVREIVRRGHSVENHSYRHSPAFACFGIARMSREIDLAQQVVSGIAGRAPSFFRAPAGFRSPMLDFVLARRGLQYVSWTRRGFDSARSDRGRVLERLTRGLAAGDVLLLHDSSPVVLEVLPALLDALAARGLKSVALPSAL
jgi:peptidoglycan/xylan/chitin deacetylase (PgdA/CDA1 family)